MEKKPRPAPEFAVGDWVYNNHAGHNAKVTSVWWDESAHGYNGGWRYSVPGLSALRMYREEPDKPYGVYEQVHSHCWRLVERVEAKPE